MSPSDTRLSIDVEPKHALVVPPQPAPCGEAACLSRCTPVLYLHCPRSGVPHVGKAMASLLGARRRHSDLEALPISSVARRRLPHLSPNSARAKLRTHEITRGVVPPVWSGVSDSSGESRGNLTARGSSPIITTARGRAPIPPPPSVPLPGPSPRSVSTDGYHSAPAPGEASGGGAPAEEHPDDVEYARRSVAAAVETAMASARERPVSEFLDEMEDRITGMMDVGAEYRTPFASPAFAAQDLEHTQQLLCKRVVAAADNHVVFDPDINDPDDGVSIFLTVVYVWLPVCRCPQQQPAATARRT